MNISSKATFIGLLSALMMLSSASLLFAGSATLSWNAPTTHADGTPLTDLAGYKIYYGTARGSYAQSRTVGNVTSYTLANLTDGATYFFAVAAVTSTGYESDLSNEASKVISSADTTPPGKPGRPTYQP